MDNLSKTLGLAGPCKQSGKLTIASFVLFAICLFGRGAEAQYGGGNDTIDLAETSTYVFLSDQSAVVQTGGIAGVHETYSIEGQFRLIIDFDTGMASFDQVDANLVDESPFLPTQSLGELFNMAELVGTVVDETTIEFEGKTADGTNTDILLRLTFRDDSVHLTGRTVPPPNSADFFIYELDAVAWKKYGGGSGTAEDPYLIYTAEQMNAIGANQDDWDKHFKLMADIDLSKYSGDEFNVIGGCCYESDWIDVLGWIDRPFTGIFDGNGHIISNFSYTSTNASYVGLFGYVGTWGKEAVIKDLGLIDPNVDAGTGSYVGSLVGVLRNGTVTNCYVEGGSVVGGDSVGGLVGAYGEGMRDYPDPPFTISNCYSTSSVQGTMRVGGLVGSNYEGRITNSYATGNVSGKWDVGGLVGQNGSRWDWPPTPGTILNCYSTGLVSGESNMGGLVGLHVEGSVIGCLWDIETSGQLRSACGAGKATTEMKTADTFAGWGGCGNEGIWTIDEGNDYPRLWWESKPGILLEGQLSDFLRGDGTEDDPYLIYTAEQINMIGMFPCEWGKHFKLMADVDLKGLTGTDFNIIGVDWTNPFTGVFDGNSHTISHFTYISTDRSSIGLFGYVIGENVKIKDLGMTDSYVYANAGTGTRAWSVGSMVGHLEDGTITDCHVDGGSVSGNEIVGGLVGYSLGTITNCYSVASVTGDERVGGLVGLNSSIYLSKRGEITNCYSVGSVSGNEIVGGLAGVNSGTITYCYSVASVTGDERVGGLIGHNGGSVKMSYSSGPVAGNEDVGGFVGSNWGRGSITMSYSIGPVTGNDCVGGLVGSNTKPLRIEGVVSHSFWDMETSGLSRMCGIQEGGDASGCDNSYGRTTAEMQMASTFLEAGWDFVDETANGTDDIWWILEGQSYPRLWWQYGLAFSPFPHDGAVDITQPLLLSWLPGGSFIDHDIYFGEDKEVIANATNESSGIYRGRQVAEMTTYDPGTLEWGRTYYWRIDEINEADPNSPWVGNVWSFTTADFILIDDFEDYNDYPPDEIFSTCIDGYNVPENGAIVCYCDMACWWCSRCNPKPVHGGAQSMDIRYDNSGPAYYSEATKTLVYPRDWTEEGVGVLSLWLYGDPNNDAERMYVALKGNAVVYHDNPDAALIDTWTEWKIDLQEFAAKGVNLANVNTITIGFGDKNNIKAGGSGLVFFDDIRLYRPAPQESEPETGTDDIWWILEGQDYRRLWWELDEEDYSVVATKNRPRH